MKPAAFRLVLTLALFIGWLGYLGYLVATRPVTPGGAPLVLSRPQILASRVDIIAEITDPHEPVEVIEVLWPEGNAPVHKGEKIKVARIADCRSPRLIGNEPPPDDWTPGVKRYLVPLRPAGEKGAYEVAPIPPSPGFAGGFDPPVRIYPNTPEARAQYRNIKR